MTSSDVIGADFQSRFHGYMPSERALKRVGCFNKQGWLVVASAVSFIANFLVNLTVYSFHESVAFITHCDWLKTLASPQQPIRCKNQTQTPLGHTQFPALVLIGYLRCLFFL